MVEYNFGLLYGGLAAGANLMGGALVTARRDWDARLLRATLALGSGFMLAATLLDIIPASLEIRSQSRSLSILAGYLLVQLAQRAFGSHAHSHGGTVHAGHSHRAPRGHAQAVHLPPDAGIMALVGLAIHTFFDGVAIGAGYQVSSSLGLLIFMAVILHKTPEGFTLASIVLAATGRRMLAFGSAALLGVSTVAGALFANALAGRHEPYALAFSGGVTLYVVASDLIPEVTSDPGTKNLLLLLSGVLLYALTDHLLHLVGIP
jgi:zinc and cadmium transporter